MIVKNVPVNMIVKAIGIMKKSITKWLIESNSPQISNGHVKL